MVKSNSLETASISSKHSEKHVEDEIRINPRLPMKNNFLEIIKVIFCIAISLVDLLFHDFLASTIIMKPYNIFYPILIFRKQLMIPLFRWEMETFVQMMIFTSLRLIQQA